MSIPTIVTIYTMPALALMFLIFNFSFLNPGLERTKEDINNGIEYNFLVVLCSFLWPVVLLILFCHVIKQD